MDNKYLLKITPAAAGDLENIYNYINKTFMSKNVANNLIKTINEKLKSLKYFPYSCELSRNTSLKLLGYRRLIVKNYVALYIIDEENKQVIIARILYGPMDYSAHI